MSIVQLSNRAKILVSGARGPRGFASGPLGAGSVDFETLTTDDGELKQITEALIYNQGGADAADRPLYDRLRETVSVADYWLAIDIDDTNSFNRAIATGKRVTVPWRSESYSVSNIDVVEGMQITGEKNGLNQAPLLLVNADETSAFYNSSDEILFYVTLENLACAAAPGVIGASFYKQLRQDRYSAHFTFRNIETHLSLKTSYIGLFIFPVWDRCRDGGEGSASDTEHSFLQALADSYGQRDQQNVFKFRDCIINNAYGVSGGAITASYGGVWSFDNCDFESCTVSAFVGYNIEQVEFASCWIEGIRAPNTIQLRTFPATPAASSAIIRNCKFVYTGTAGVPVAEVIGLDNLCTVAIEHSTFNLIPAGVKLTNTGDRITVNKCNAALSGDGAAGFFAGTHHDTYASGRRMLNGAVDNAVPNMTLQNDGGISATKGLMSGHDIAVGTSFVTIATSQTGLGGTAVISGFDPSNGTQFRVIKDWQGATIRDVVALLNSTTKTLTFQTSGDDLQMKVDAGTATVFTTLLH